MRTTWQYQDESATFPPEACGTQNITDLAAKKASEDLSLVSPADVESLVHRLEEEMHISLQRTIKKPAEEDEAIVLERRREYARGRVASACSDYKRALDLEAEVWDGEPPVHKIAVPDPAGLVGQVIVLLENSDEVSGPVLARLVRKLAYEQYMEEEY